MPNFRGVAALLAAVSFSALLVLTFWKPDTRRVLLGPRSGDVPTALAGFESTGDYQMPASVQAALPGARILSRTYRDIAHGDAGAVDFTLVSGSSRDSLHDPRYCLTGGGWRLSDFHAEALPGLGGRMAVCEAATTAAAPDQSVAYFYVVGGRVISDPTEIRAQLLWSALLGRQGTPAYFFRFVQPLAAGAGANAAQHARLVTFAAQMYRALKPRIG